MQGYAGNTAYFMVKLRNNVPRLYRGWDMERETDMVEFETKYTYERYKQYYWFSLFRGKYYRYSKATFPFITALMIALAILSFTWIDSILSAVISTVATVICILFYVLASIMPKRYVKQSPALFQGSITIIFNEDDFSTIQTGDIASGTGITKYEALNKVYETKDTFYVYLTPVQALLLAKKDIVKGTPEELRGLLKSKLPQGKYIICK